MKPTPWDRARRLIEYEAQLAQMASSLRSMGLRDDPAMGEALAAADAIGRALEAVSQFRALVYQGVEDTRGHVTRRTER